MSENEKKTFILKSIKTENKSEINYKKFRKNNISNEDENVKELEKSSTSDASTYYSDEEESIKPSSSKEAVLKTSNKPEWIDVKNISSGGDDIAKISDSSAAEISFSSDDERDKHYNKKNLWDNQELPDDNVCDIEDCTFEPDRHEKHPHPKRMMSMMEKKILIKYLVQSNKIKQGKGLKVYREMHDDGYLTHRSDETLRNCVRRTISPNIAIYNLPVDIEDQFITLDEKKKAGKKKLHNY